MGTLSFTFGVIIIINFLFVISIFLVLNTMNLSRLKVEEKNNELEKEIITISQQINQVERDAVEYTNSQVGELKSKVYKDFDLIRNQGRQY